MRPRKVVLHLSRDERQLVSLFRTMVPFAKEVLTDHAKGYAKLSAKLRGPVPCNLLAFRTEATERAAAVGIGKKDKGEASPSRPDAF